MNIYLVMTFGGIIGVVLHTFKTVRDIKKGIADPKVKFNLILKEFWTSEWMSLLGSGLCFAALLFIASEFVNFQAIDKIDYAEPLKDRLLHFQLSNFAKTTSIIAGYFSDSIVYGFLGVTQHNIQKKLADLDTKP